MANPDHPYLLLRHRGIYGIISVGLTQTIPCSVFRGVPYIITRLKLLFVNLKAHLPNLGESLVIPVFKVVRTLHREGRGVFIHLAALRREDANLYLPLGLGSLDLDIP